MSLKMPFVYHIHNNKWTLTRQYALTRLNLKFFDDLLMWKYGNIFLLKLFVEFALRKLLIFAEKRRKSVV